MISFGDTSPAAAVELLLRHTTPVEPCTHPLTDPAEVVGRVLAEPLRLDRDSPACDASAMDGYAVRHAEFLAGTLPVAGECRIGQPPADLPPGAALRIYTGSPIPTGADTVVRLEWTTADGDAISPREGKPTTHGQDIRRAGENAKRGDVVLPAGTPLARAAIGALASIGPASLVLHRRLRVAVLTTGDEVVDHTESSQLGDAFPAWRLRNSNGPVLAAMMRGLPFVAGVTHTHVPDMADALVGQLREAATSHDAVVLTGGVSQGAYDFVRGAVEATGGQLLFHGVTARPGRPTLGAVFQGTPVLGLPGNPVAVLTTSRRLLAPVLRGRAGFANPEPGAPLVTIDTWGTKTLPLSWWRPVTLTGEGRARLASLRGSGDVCGPAATDGFIEAPSNANHTGPFPFYQWDV